VLAATNRPDAIDPAILSRFVEQIEIALPDQEQRKQLIAVFLSGVICDNVADIADRLAQPQLTANYSRRDLGQLVNRAILAAVKRSGSAHTFRLQWSDFPVPTKEE
jgi:SpoVK/Ycf46/Vps4 family AAA+-type ATPase